MPITTHTSDPRLIGIYLNDHLAGATGGVDLARRLARSHRGTEAGPALDRVAREIAEDREELLAILDRLGVPVSRYKAVAAWFGEKLGRLKLNGRLFARSPLSSVLELEAMALGVHGKLAGWRSLRTVAEHDRRLDPAKLDELIARAEHQHATLEDLRMHAVRQVLAPAAPNATM